MSDLIEAILLGIIQGLTEFLPVSSSGHLELAKVMFGYDKSAEESMLLTVILHAATALSTMVIFRKEIIEIITGLVSFDKEQVDFSGKIILSMIPAAIVGVLFDDHLEALFDRQILLVGLMLVLTGALLFLADQAKNTSKRVSWGNAFIIGIAQMVAILPGISRSGATISTSVLLGIDRTRAAKFSFLMVVPLILGKMAKDILSGEITYAEGELIPLAAGFVAAFVTGLLACTWMIALVKKSKLSYFAYYCFMVAAFAIAKGLGWF
ncbi:MAG: undecaprenyl-diphosphate phosphatase [Saprospiraceae bacterium]|mgnify:CR=1 FL=1|jgi:undecaprenyl-diphosphatase|nr:undecaprenyl-diphosphate phosphatase [Saprospiraceae bacterium]